MAGVKIDQYGDHFVEKGQSFHVFYDVFCEFRQVKNKRRVNRHKVLQLIEANKSQKYRRNSRFFAGFLEIIAIFAEFGQKSLFVRSFNRGFLRNRRFNR